MKLSHVLTQWRPARDADVIVGEQNDLAVIALKQDGDAFARFYVSHGARAIRTSR